MEELEYSGDADHDPADGGEYYYCGHDGGVRCPLHEHEDDDVYSFVPLVRFVMCSDVDGLVHEANQKRNLFGSIVACVCDC